MDQKRIVTKTGKEIIYEKLILATDSIPTVPKNAGADLPNVFTISKDAKYLSSVLEKTRTCGNIVIIAGS